MTRRAALLGTGSALPKTRVTNQELAQRIDTSDEWIVERTGIRARHIAGEGETTATLAIEASLKAIDAAGMKPGDRSEEHTYELQVTNAHPVCRLLLAKNKHTKQHITP